MKISKVTATSADLQWLAPDRDGGSPITEYILEVSINKREWTKLSSVDSYSTKYKAQEYVFRFSAVNKLGPSEPLVSEPVTPKRDVGEWLYD